MKKLNFITTPISKAENFSNVPVTILLLGNLEDKTTQYFFHNTSENLYEKILFPLQSDKGKQAPC